MYNSRWRNYAGFISASLYSVFLTFSETYFLIAFLVKKNFLSYEKRLFKNYNLNEVWISDPTGNKAHTLRGY